MVVSCATGLRSRAAFTNALHTGTHLHRDDVVAVRGRRVGITGEVVGYDTDGELEDEVASRSYELLADAWHLVC